MKEYGKDEVIKLSSLSRFLGSRHSKKLIQDYIICNAYLKKYITPTDYTKIKNQHIEVQKYIAGEKLQKKHFKNRDIKKQFTDILEGITNMQKDGLAPIDLIGFHGTIKLCFDNIIVTKDMKLCIIDIALLETKSIGIVGYIFHPLMLLTRIIQSSMIRRFMKY